MLLSQPNLENYPHNHVVIATSAGKRLSRLTQDEMTVRGPYGASSDCEGVPNANPVRIKTRRSSPS